MSLTPIQEKFAQNVAKGMTFSDAYRNSYDASKLVDETVHKRASGLAQKGEIAGRINKLKEQLSERQLWSREDSIKKLIEVMSDARPNDVIAAIKELNNMHGFDAPSKIELSGNMLHQIQRRIVDDVSDD